MAGQIIKRGERNFVVRVYLGTDASGKRDYLNQTVKGSKKDAQALLNKLLRDKDMGVLVEPARMSLDEYLDHWLSTSVKPRVRERTHKEYAATLRRHVREPLGSRRLGSLKPVDIQGLYTALQAAGRTKSVRYVHTVLRDALNQAVKWQMLQMNPADFVDLPRQERTKMRALSQDEVSRLLEAASGSKWCILFSFMLGTGLRPSEALGLQWPDIDLVRGAVSVRRTLARVNGRWLFEEPKTKSSRRTVPLPLGLTAELSDHLSRQLELGFTDLVFCNRNGGPSYERGIVQCAFKPALTAAGLPSEVRFYDLRHTHATLLLMAGVHPKVVAERLGHSNISITLDTYSHVLPNMQQEAAEHLNTMLYPARPRVAAHVKN